MAQPICVFGGTFNPPHLGHVRACLEAADEIGVNQVGLMPSKLPPHKGTAGVDEHDRVAMVKLACAYSDRLFAELIELTLPAPSYSVKTLGELRQRHPTTPLVFMMGQDSWDNLPSWHEWESIHQLAHLVVLRRHGEFKPAKPDSRLTALAETAGTTNVRHLHQQPAGCIYFANTQLQPVSSTTLRNALAGNDENKHEFQLTDWLSDSVLHYIKEKRLYV